MTICPLLYLVEDCFALLGFYTDVNHLPRKLALNQSHQKIQYPIAEKLV